MSGGTEPTVSGFPWSSDFPSWLTWTGSDKTWEVTLGDSDGHLFPGQSPDDAQAITVSAGPHAGARWFETTDPRGLAAALIAAADSADGQCWRCVREQAAGWGDEKCGRHVEQAAS